MAADNRAVARTGGDPRRARTISFAEADPRALAEKAETWRDGSPSLRDWRASMAAYVLPELGRMHVGAVATADVKRVLRSVALAASTPPRAWWREASRRCWSGRRWRTCASQPAAVETALRKVDGHPRIARVV